MFRPESKMFRTGATRRALVFMAVIGILFCSPPCAATTDFTAAGVLLIAKQNGSAFILLGKDRYRPWYETLAGSREVVPDGGGADVSRRETAYETALRECFEESRGFLKPDYLLAVTDPAVFVRDGSFVFFRAEIEKFSADEIKRQPIPEDANSAAFREIVDYAWVSVEAVLSANDVFVFDDIGRRIQVRRRLKDRLVQARAAGWL
jgi:8-oxo-dGTP pyrophosphatase MutT (NUDIX family)